MIPNATLTCAIRCKAPLGLTPRRAPLASRYTTDTNEWCAREREKVDLAYQQLEEATVRMRVMHPEQERDILQLNVAGKEFTVPKSPEARLRVRGTRVQAPSVGTRSQVLNARLHVLEFDSEAHTRHAEVPVQGTEAQSQRCEKLRSEVGDVPARRQLPERHVQRRV